MQNLILWYIPYLLITQQKLLTFEEIYGNAISKSSKQIVIIDGVQTQPSLECIFCNWDKSKILFKWIETESYPTNGKIISHGRIIVFANVPNIGPNAFYKGWSLTIWSSEENDRKIEFQYIVLISSKFDKELWEKL